MPTRADTVKALRQAGVIAVVRTSTVEQAVAVVKALYAGGVTAAEVTFTVPDADQAIAQLRDLRDSGELPNLVLGAGTVTSAEQANAAIDAGSAYLVSPHLAMDVIEVAKLRDVAMLPGALTPGEVFAAHQAGADIVKIFPAARMGPSYLKDLRGPYPHIALMPTGGVSAENVHEWLSAGAVAVGVGSELVYKPAIAAGDYGDIQGRAEEFMAALAAARLENH